MTPNRDLDRALDSWLTEGPMQLPDHAIERIVRRIEETNQRRPAWLPGGQRMNRLMPWIGAAAAAVLAVAALVYVNPGDRGGVGGPPAATPSPTAAPSPSPSATAADRSLPEGPFVLSDGEFDDGVRNVPITVTIPARGWYGEPGNGFLEKGNPAENFGPEDAGLIGPFVGDVYVPADPCRWSTTLPNSPATTVDELIAALQGQASRDASEPVDITVDGHAGKSITLHVPDDAVFDECDPSTAEPQPRFCTLAAAEAADCQRSHQFPGQIDELWIVDVNGQLMVVDGMYSDETPPEDVAELRAILASMTFE